MKLKSALLFITSAHQSTAEDFVKEAP